MVTENQDQLTIRRAAGAVLRAWRRPGIPLGRLGGAGRGEPVRPALAIEALVAAMRARFGLAQEAAGRLLLPALADWRDAVGCADPLLVPANAQGPAAEKALVPLPVPSWCAWLADAGVLRFDGPPSIQGPRVVQPAWLLVVREAELSAVECFPLLFAGRFGSGTASMHVHLALSPPFLAEAWRGSICLRAAAHRIVRGGHPVSLWLGGPALPVPPEGGAPAGTTGETVATWVVNPRTGPPSVEGREPQALWDLTALWRARLGSSPEAASGGASAGAAGNMRLAVDIGSTSTVVVEEDSAAAGAVGSKLLCESRGWAPPSGFRRLAGDPLTAHRYGCSEQLLAPSGQLPTTLAAAGPASLTALLRAKSTAAAADQVWLPQASPEPGADESEECLRADRFKSPELLLLSDWLAELPRESGLDPVRVSRRLLETYGYLLGRALAAAHGAPLVTPEGGRWTLRWPFLGAAEAILTYPQCAWSATSAEPFSLVFDGVGRELCRGLSSAWAAAAHRMVADPAAARAGCDQPQDERHPIEAFVDFGGLTLQITVRVPNEPGRPAPFIAGSSMSYLLGGERLIDSAAYANADLDGTAALREAYRATARRWRLLIASGGHLGQSERAAAGALRQTVLEVVLALLGRQLEGTLRRAAPGLVALRGADVRLHLLGEGWKLLALDAPDERREEEALRYVEECLASQPPFPAVALQLQRMTKRRLCEGALRARSAAEACDEAIELQGLDVSATEGLRQRWFGIADADAPADASVAPLREDPWWRAFTAGAGRDGSLLRVEQWFTAPRQASPFPMRLSGGKLAFDSRRSILKQWLDVSGPSLIALRIHAALLQSRAGDRPSAPAT